MPARSFLECPVFEGELASGTVEASHVLTQDFPAAPCQQDVVISGVSCRLPESDNMAEYRDNLMNGVDMVTGDDRRWKPGNNKHLPYIYFVCPQLQRSCGSVFTGSLLGPGTLKFFSITDKGIFRLWSRAFSD